MRALLICCLATILIASCGEKEQKYVPSKEHEGLPAKTDTGNNIAGALVNGTAWLSSMRGGGIYNDYRNLMTFRTLQTDTAQYLRIDLYGKVNAGFYEGYEMDFAYMIAGSGISELGNITKWRNDTLRAADEDSYVEINSSSELIPENVCNGGNGWMHFSKIAEQDNDNYLLAGTFEFTIRNECGYIRVTKGRFDFILEELN